MKYLPVYFLIDVSESMIGEPLDWLQKELDQTARRLRADPYTSEKILISIIVFAGKVKRILPLTDPGCFYPVNLPIGWGTCTGRAVSFLMEELDTCFSLNKEEDQEAEGVPLVFLLTDGLPTDLVESAFVRWNSFYRCRTELIAVSIERSIDVSFLNFITSSVVVLKHATSECFIALFDWIITVIREKCKKSRPGRRKPLLSLVDKEYISSGYLAVKNKNTVSDTFVVVAGKCQITKSLYLIKYAKKNDRTTYGEAPGYEELVLIGAYPVNRFRCDLPGAWINRRIHPARLRDFPVCPCCGNRYGFVVCECGRIFCADEHSYNKCPWCNRRGVLVHSDLSEDG